MSPVCRHKELHVRTCRYDWGGRDVVWVVRGDRRGVAVGGDLLVEDVPWQLRFDPFH